MDPKLLQAVSVSSHRMNTKRDFTHQLDREQIVKMLLNELYGPIECEEAAVHYYDAAITPPIAMDNLIELPTKSIVDNGRLRHDLNFDMALKLRPNSDSRAADSKKEAEVSYWAAVAVELRLYGGIRGYNGPFDKPSMVKTCHLRIRPMLETIKTILETLVPEYSRSEIERRLDVPTLMREIESGVYDLSGTVKWLASLLKEHCAPPRDQMVDLMVEKMSRSGEKSVSDGLDTLFSVLEAMKLDVANHNIDCLRQSLIENTIEFEKGYHLAKIEIGKYDVSYARYWYHCAREGLGTTSVADRDLRAFLTALLSSLTTSTKPWPDIFHLDSNRLRVLATDLDNFVCEELCCEIFKQVLDISKDCNMDMATDSTDEFRASLYTVINGESEAFAWRTNPIAVKIAHAVGRKAEDRNIVQTIEKMLKRCFLDVALKAACVQALQNEMLPQVLAHVKNHINSSPITIFETLGSSLHLMPDYLPVAERFQGMIQRLAHIAVLHWRVWEDIAYNKDDLTVFREGAVLAPVRS